MDWYITTDSPVHDSHIRFFKFLVRHPWSTKKQIMDKVNISHRQFYIIRNRYKDYIESNVVKRAKQYSVRPGFRGFILEV